MRKPVYKSESEDGLIFRPAEAGDVETATKILRAAARRMMEEGKHQWTEKYPSRENVMKDIEKGLGFVVESSGQVMAYGAVIFDGEPAYRDLKGKWLSNENYVVVHRLAVSLESECKGLARFFLASVENFAESKGIYSFRVDTNYDNDRMLSLLRKTGFIYCGEITYESGGRMAFEKILL